MPDLNLQPVEGGPTQPVYVMNDAKGAPGSDRGSVANTTSTTGNNTIVSSPGVGFRIVLWSFLIVNEAATSNTVTIRDQAARFRCMLGAAIGSNMGQVFPFGYRMNENTALTLALSAATAIGYSIIYSVEPV